MTMKAAHAYIGCTAILLVLGTGQSTTGTDPLNAKLIAAVKAHDTVAAKTLLRQGADPNARELVLTKPNVATDDGGGKSVPKDTALILAVTAGDEPTVTLLLDHGADIEKRDAYGFTPLICAVSSHKFEVAKMLLDRGAKPDQRNMYGDTALVFAANDGQNNLVKLLLSKGADINGGGGDTPLMHAAYNGFNETVRLLLDRGADPNLTHRGSVTPVESALNNYNSEGAEMIRKAGGKGRSQDEIEKERAADRKQFEEMKARRQKENATLWLKQAKLSDTDRIIIEVAALDQLKRSKEDMPGWKQAGKGDIVMLVNETLGEYSGIQDDQMNSDLKAEQAKDVTLEMRRDLMRRNPGAMSLSSLKLNASYVSLRTQKPIGSFLGKDRAPWVWVYLPGFSASGDNAVLRVNFGPTEHGASATYLFVRKNGKWTISWRHDAHYV